jgi:imidazolonepropionase-like amidohydrolase
LLAFTLGLGYAGHAADPRPDAAIESRPRGGNVAIVHAQAYTMVTDAALHDATIVVRDGRIVSVSRGGSPPAGIEVVDAAGRIVTPALMNSGTQIGLVEVTGDPDTADQGVDSGALRAAFDLQYAIDANSLTVQKARVDGVSRALVFPSGAGAAPFSGLAALLHLVPGPDVLERPRSALVAVIGGGVASRAGGSRSVEWQLLHNALDEATLARSQGGLDPDTRMLGRLDLQAIQHVLDTRTPLLLAVNRESDIRQALRLKSDYDVPVVLFGAAEAWRAAPELARAGIPVVLDPYADLPMSYDEIGARRDNAARLASAGVTIAFTVSGAGIYLSYQAGPALREGAGIAVANGLPRAEALRALTVNPARIWGIADRYGTLEPGRDGDIVIWDGDPLEPSSAPVQVFSGGLSVPLRTRQTELRDRYKPAVSVSPGP